MRWYTYPLGENEKKFPLYIVSVGEKNPEGHVGPAPHFQCYYQLLYTHSGCGHVRINDFDGNLTEGTGFLLEPYEPREYFPTSEKPWHTKWITFGGDFVQPLLKLIPGKRNGKFTIKNQAMIDEKISNMLNHKKADNTPDNTAPLLFDFLLNLRHCVSFEPDDAMYNVYKVRLEPLIKYFYENLTEAFDLPKAARLIGCSPVHLCKIFKRVYNMRPNEYLTIMRIKNAQNLLSSQLNLTVAEIGLLSGYEDASYFSKKFRQQTGVTPGEFRDNYVSLTSFGLKEAEVPSDLIEKIKFDELMKE